LRVAPAILTYTVKKTKDIQEGTCGERKNWLSNTAGYYESSHKHFVYRERVRVPDKGGSPWGGMRGCVCGCVCVCLCLCVCVGVCVCVCVCVCVFVLLCG